MKKDKNNARRESDGTSSKSVRFSTGGESIYYTFSSSDYDRRSMSIGSSSITTEHEGDYLKQPSINQAEEEEIEFDEEVIRNTKVNKKQGHHSIAALIMYRSNI